MKNNSKARKRERRLSAIKRTQDSAVFWANNTNSPEEYNDDKFAKAQTTIANTFAKL